MSLFDEAYDRNILEMAARLVKPVTFKTYAPMVIPRGHFDIIHTCCVCGRTFTGPEWGAADLCTSIAVPDGLSCGMECRNCTCGGTMVIEVGLDEES